MAAGEFVRLNTLGLFNSILFFLFCPLGLALIPHRQMKRSVLNLLICYVIYLLHKCFSFFSTSQQAIHHRFFVVVVEKQKNVMYYKVSKISFSIAQKKKGHGERRGKGGFHPLQIPWTALSLSGKRRD